MATEIRKPTNYSDPTNSFTDEINCYDTTTAGDTTTYGYTYNSTTSTPVVDLISWQTTTFSYSALTLNVKWNTSGIYTDDTFEFLYSTNGGSSWSTLLANNVYNNTSIVTTSVALSTSTDLSQLQFRMNFTRVGGGDIDYTYIYDVWTSGGYTPPVGYSKKVNGVSTYNKINSISKSSFTKLNGVS